MHHELFIVRVVGYNGVVFTPTNLYITNSFMYHRYVENAVYNYREGIEFLVDSIEDNEDHGVLVINGDTATYRDGEGLGTSPVKVYTALIPQFDNTTEYANEDVVYFSGRAYFRNRAGSGNWNRNDWTEIIGGHTLSTLTYYLHFDLSGGDRQLGEGTFFYGDTLEFAEKPFKPEESYKIDTGEIEIVKDINDRFFEQFYADYAIHDGTVLHEEF